MGNLIMGNLIRRIERAESGLDMDQAPIIVKIVDFSGGALPPEERRGNVTIRHVPYDGIQAGRRRRA